MDSAFFFWFSLGSLIINILLMVVSIGLLVANRKEKERRNSQVKIWMQHANGLTHSLQRIIRDKLDGLYSDTQDVVNTVHAVESTSFALYQSLYEERVITEEEYKKEQAELRKLTRDSGETQQISPTASATKEEEGKKAEDMGEQPSSKQQ